MKAEMTLEVNKNSAPLLIAKYFDEDVGLYPMVKVPLDIEYETQGIMVNEFMLEIGRRI